MTTRTTNILSVLLVGCIAGTLSGCATAESTKSPNELTSEGKLIAIARKRSGTEGDYKVRTASTADNASDRPFVLSKEQCGIL